MKKISELKSTSLTLLTLLLVSLYLVAQGFIEGTIFTGFIFAAIVLPLWPAALGFIAFFKPDFKKIYLLYATLLWMTWDLAGLNYFISDFMAEMLDRNINPQWITLFLIAGAALLNIFALFKTKSIFRIMSLVFLLAQMTVLPMFHYVTIGGPLAIDRELRVESRDKTQNLSINDLENHCQQNDLICYTGDMNKMGEILRETPNPQTTIKVLVDVINETNFYHTWQESNFPDGQQKFDSLKYTTVNKRVNTFHVMIDSIDPDKRFVQWALSFSLLSTLFHFAWIMFVSFIVSRHRNYMLLNGKWTVEH